MSHLSKLKAPSLSDRLNDASVHAAVSNIAAPFPPKEPNDISRVLGADVVIDCTGNDEVAEHMRRFRWGNNVTFFSISVGLKSRRLFVYTAHSDTFPAR